jgi:hypothetical protein
MEPTYAPLKPHVLVTWMWWKSTNPNLKLPCNSFSPTPSLSSHSSCTPSHSNAFKGSSDYLVLSLCSLSEVIWCLKPALNHKFQLPALKYIIQGQLVDEWIFKTCSHGNASPYCLWKSPRMLRGSPGNIVYSAN